MKNFNRFILENYTPVFNKEGELTVLTKNGPIRFDIESAKDPSEIQKGLMFRKSMNENEGMLFIFEEEGFWKFWMKNTYMPLDIIYINKDKEIVDIKKNTQPLSLKSLTPYEKSLYVFEVNGEICDRFSIKIGDKVNFFI